MNLLFSRRICVCAVIAVISAQFISMNGARAQVRNTIIAATGDTAPAGGNYTDLPSNPVLNARGQVVFDAFLNGPSATGVFLNDGLTISTIALGGNPDPAAGNFGEALTPALAANGDVIFRTERGIFRGDGKRFVPLMQNGDAAPGGGSVMLSGAFVVNSRGAIVYNGRVIDGLGTQGLFRNNGDRITAIARDNVNAPTGGTFLFFGSPAFNDEGEAAFFAGMTGGSADFGIYRGDGEKITTIFAANKPAPGGGTFVDFSDPVMNKHSQVLVSAFVDNGPSPIGIFLGDGTNAAAIALAGQAAPKTGNYSSFFGPMLLNDRSQVAFEARLTGSTSRSGVFRFDGSTTTPIALEATAAAGTTGTFDTFGDMRMGRDGRIVFIATLKIGVGGVNFSNNIGIWIGSSETDLRLIARSGEVIGGKTLVRPLGLGQLEVNERKFVWRGRFLGNSIAIVATDLDTESID